MTSRRSLELGLSRDEILRVLPQAVGSAFHQNGDCYVHAWEGHRWHLKLTELPGRRLGALNLDRTRVEFAFDGFGPDEVEAFLRRFRLHLHRGGG